MEKRRISIILYDRFEVLDAFGPAEMFASLPVYMQVDCYSERGGIVKSTQNVLVDTKPFDEIPEGSTILIPGGVGARSLVVDAAFIETLKEIAQGAEYVLTVCTGSLLLAKTGLLDDKKATTNKMAFSWVAPLFPQVAWQKCARWVKDGNCYTSSGVSAGMDMALGFITDVYSEDDCTWVEKYTEYVWNKNADEDPFVLE